MIVCSQPASEMNFLQQIKSKMHPNMFRDKGLGFRVSEQVKSIQADSLYIPSMIHGFLIAFSLEGSRANASSHCHKL